MALSEAQRKASEKYIKGNFDPVTLRLPKGRKEIVQEFVLRKGMSLNTFINEAIVEKMEREEST